MACAQTCASIFVSLICADYITSCTMTHNKEVGESITSNNRQDAVTNTMSIQYCNNCSCITGLREEGKATPWGVRGAVHVVMTDDGATVEVTVAVLAPRMGHAYT